MGALSRAGDLVYTLRFLRLLTTPWKETNAFKLGIIDENGKRIKSKKVETATEKSAYNYFHRLVFSLKRLLNKIPLGSTTIASYAAALFLIKEHLNLSEKSINKIIKESGIDPLDFLNEQTQWFVLDDEMLSPGVYKIREERAINSTCEQIVNRYDKIKILPESYPVGRIMGLAIYEAVHLPTNQKLYITVGELIK